MKLLAVDGNSILNRSYYGIKLLSTKNGIYTNAVYGFITVMNRMTSEIKPDYVAIAFDMKAPTFRHKMYDKYKANRKGMPDELAMQLPIIKEILVLMGYKIIEAEGYEADDILGTLADICEKNNTLCVIATGDRDSLQLVSENVTVRLATNREAVIYDVEKIREDYNIEPKQFVDVKALMGDASDNIPGVKGIGEKTAFSLISEHKNIDCLYENLNGLNLKERTKSLLANDEESARMSRELAAICKDAPINGDLETYRTTESNNQKLYEKFAELEMKSLISKMGLSGVQESSINLSGKNMDVDNIVCEKNFQILKNPDINILKEKIANLPYIDFILKTEKDSICALLIDLGAETAVFDFNAENTFYEIISLEKEARTYDAKCAYRFLLKSNIKADIIFDAALAGYLLDSNQNYDLEALKNTYLTGYEIENTTIEKEISSIYCFAKLCDTLYEKIKEKFLEKLLYEIELPLSETLASMEIEGFKVDTYKIEQFGKNLDERIEALKKSIFNLAGEEFNPNSTKELGVILFDKLLLPAGKKTKTGYSTGADVLEKLLGKHPIIEHIIEYRHLTKLKSTYVTGLLKVTGNDGRIRSKFKQTETRTGRISSTEPNMQNIPVRTELGREMRKFFTARDGYVLLDADYSQIELRVLAHISNDLNMIDNFKKGADIHTITASQVFSVPLEEVTSDLRRKAKAVNFGIVYGISPYSLSEDIHVSIPEAKKYIEDYLETFKNVKEYMADIISESKKNGYVKTLMGRRRDLPEILSSNHNIRSFGERVALNTPIQGTAADIIKIAMVKIYKRLAKENLDAKLILQVHDELIIESSIKDMERASYILKYEMENAVELSVPLLAEVSSGETWYDTK